jgi:hypothetical protein
MTLPELHSLMLIFTIAVVAPLLCEWIPRIRLPLVVMEISLGILIGPQVLGWAAAGPTIQVLANFGLAFLFFLAGFEIDFPAIKGRRFSRRPSDGSCPRACPVAGFSLQFSGLIDSGLIVGRPFDNRFGTLMPILRDAGSFPRALASRVAPAPWAVPPIRSPWLCRPAKASRGSLWLMPCSRDHRCRRVHRPELSTARLIPGSRRCTRALAAGAVRNLRAGRPASWRETSDSTPFSAHSLRASWWRWRRPVSTAKR